MAIVGELIAGIVNKSAAKIAEEVASGTSRPSNEEFKNILQDTELPRLTIDMPVAAIELRKGGEGREVFFFGIDVNDGLKTWRVHRRYSEFHLLLISCHGTFMTIFPPKTHWFIASRSESERRRPRLEQWLQRVVLSLSNEALPRKSYGRANLLLSFLEYDKQNKPPLSTVQTFYSLWESTIRTFPLPDHDDEDDDSE